jgi:hypothetical protein
MVTTQAIIDKFNSITLITPAEEVLEAEGRRPTVQQLPSAETMPARTEAATPVAIPVEGQPVNTAETAETIVETTTDTEQASSLGVLSSWLKNFLLTDGLIRGNKLA